MQRYKEEGEGEGEEEEQVTLTVMTTLGYNGHFSNKHDNYCPLLPNRIKSLRLKRLKNEDQNSQHTTSLTI